MQHPSHFVIEQLGFSLQAERAENAVLRAEIERLTAALAAADAAQQEDS